MNYNTPTRVWFVSNTLSKVPCEFVRGGKLQDTLLSIAHMRTKILPLKSSLSHHMKDGGRLILP